MNQLAKLEEFYNSLEEINLINTNIDDKREALKKEVYLFNNEIQVKEIDKKLLKQNEDIAKLLEASINLIKISSSHWVSSFENMIESEKLSSELKNYFNVIIFGKVNAGKSSLGNFIAKHKLEHQKIEFLKYTEAGKEAIKKLEELNNDKFDTNNLECTTAIQIFKLAGMAWVDTPGLGSMVKENGDLAKKYIQFADFIIYPTSSDATFDMSEQNQLKELFGQNKTVTICITKSDTPEEDECECGSLEGCENCNKGIISVFKNKSVENRKAQEAHVNNEIKKIISKDQELLLGDIISLSACVASSSLETNNEEEFKNSNIPEFYEILTDVIKEKATSLKSKTPYSGLKSLIDNIIIGNGEVENSNSIKNIKKSLDDLDRNIKESIQRFQVLQENANNDLASEIENIVAFNYGKIDKNNFKEIVETIDAQLQNKVLEIIQINIQEIFVNFETKLTSLTTSMSWAEFDIEDTFKDIAYSTASRNKKMAGGIFALAATIGAGLITRGASNAVSVVAVGIASIAGNYIGGKVGAANGSYITESIKVGDNKEEIIQKFKSTRLEHYENYANDVYGLLQDTFFKPLQTISYEIRASLETFEQKIENIYKD